MVRTENKGISDTSCVRFMVTLKASTMAVRLANVTAVTFAERTAESTFHLLSL